MNITLVFRFRFKVITTICSNLPSHQSCSIYCHSLQLHLIILFETMLTQPTVPPYCSFLFSSTWVVSYTFPWWQTRDATRALLNLVFIHKRTCGMSCDTHCYCFQLHPSRIPPMEECAFHIAHISRPAIYGIWTNGSSIPSPMHGVYGLSCYIIAFEILLTYSKPLTTAASVFRLWGTFSTIQAHPSRITS